MTVEWLGVGWFKDAVVLQAKSDGEWVPLYRVRCDCGFLTRESTSLEGAVERFGEHKETCGQ